MKKNICLFTIILIVLSVHAQWEWLNPLPQGNSISALSFIDENNGWAVGWGTIMNTNDGGLTWSIIESGFLDTYLALNLKDVFFTDTLNGWIVGGHHGCIRHTEDGGQTWSPPQGDGTKPPNDNTDVFFVDQQTGWVLGWGSNDNSAHVLRTVDGGLTWDSHNVSDNATHHNGGIYFVDNMTGWVTWGGRIRHTSDGGITWETQFDGGYIKLNDIYFYDSEYGWAVGSETVLITENGGETWEYSLNFPLQWIDIKAVSFIDHNTGWFVGIHDEVDEFGVIYMTTDGGQNWENQLNEISSYPLNCLSYNSFQSEGFAAGDRGEMLRTSNNGNSWDKVSSEVTNCHFTDIFFTDNTTGWACGGLPSEEPVANMIPAIYYSDDGGINWTQQSLPVNGPGFCTKIFFTDNQHGWANIFHLTLYNVYQICTIDGGETWEEQTSSYEMGSDIYFVNNSVGWRIGDAGAIQKSEDGGWIWENQQSGTDSDLHSLIFIDEDKGWIAGDSIVLNTIDGGETWEVQSSSPHNWKNIFFIDELHGWVVSLGYGGGSGISMKTIDGGITWEEINAGFLEVYFIDTDKGWGRSITNPSGGGASPPAYNMWYTNDGGLTWKIQPTPILIHGGFCFTDANNGWAVSYDGAILNTKNGGILSIEDSSAPDKSQLRVNLYPNPFTTSIILEYELILPEKVMLTIYNHMGKQVYQTEENQQNGSQHLIWNAEGLEAGIYFCVLKTSNEIQTKKMIKL